ncbi:MAG: hypothetical protein HYU66_00765 [Armatimonadetes bacterium]|nr:hypothetical protein [Armatimonadota bacterium]
MCSLLLLALAAPSNLLPNPDFATGLFEPDGWSLNRSEGNLAAWVCDRREPEHCAVRLTGTGHDWAGATSSRVAVTPGDVLTVAAWVRSAGVAADGGRVYVRFFQGGGFRGQTGPPVPPDAREWSCCAGTVTVPENTDAADFSLQLWSRGTVLLGRVGLFRGGVTGNLAELLPPPGPLDEVAVSGPRGLPADADGDGLADSLERFLEIPRRARSALRSRRNTTCFQTPTPYRPDNDLKTGSVLVVNEDADAIRSWQRMGYVSYFMTGFRDGPAYVEQHPGSVQQDRAGHPLDCGPGSYYMVPTADRRRVLRERFRRAFEHGADGAAPEEPEFIGSGGYSPAFRAEFEAFYHRPWVEPHTSVQARVDCQRLMGHLEVELLRACYDGARSVKPRAPAFLLCHSPLNYAAWGIMFPHEEALEQLKIDHVVAQVWTGTARTAVNHQGLRKERTFENAFLEYSSCVNLVRGRNLPLWLLMDPVEDNPDRPMADYFRNYQATLGAALMFPQTDLYEVMPWPTRIFGRVPPEFATVICTVVNALADVQSHRQPAGPSGPRGVASFISDTAMWQRQEPFTSDFDAVYGLTLPLLMQGIPVELAHLDRVGEAGYLAPYRVLLASFDALKPPHQRNVDGLVDWVRKGGALIVCGGADPYNNLGMWWKQRGCASPQEYLLRALGLNPAGAQSIQPGPAEAPFTEAATTDYTGHTLENRRVVRVDLTAAARATGAVFVRLEDTLKSDGWGPYLSSLRLVGTRGGKPLDVVIQPGTSEEAELIHSDTGSGLSGGRFVDGGNVLVYELRFDPGTQAAVELHLGNQYCVSVAPAPVSSGDALRPAADWWRRAQQAGGWRLGGALQGLAYPNLGATPVLTHPNGAVISEARVGRGTVTVCGLSPALFAKSPTGDQMLRALVAHAAKGAGLTYEEPGFLRIRRGPYEVIRTLDKPAGLSEPTVNLMTPDLAIRAAGTVPPDELLILKHLPPAGRAPRVAASSACLEWSAESGSELKLVASGPSGTPAVLRVVTGGRTIQVWAQDAAGKPVAVRVEPQGETALLRFAGEPRGVGLRVGFSR